MRIVLSAFFVALSMFAFSQTIVSTSVENKNVILEEFTGIHCGFCPDGHKIAQQIKNAHPADVFLINIHTGSYAAPGSGEPDFRTPWGTAIAGQTGLTGYPAGTVNRHLFSGLSQGSGTAMSRGNWTSASNTILGQTSCVNVAVNADVDYVTRQATVLVEVYYTSNSAQSTNYLNLALLQDYVKGPQSGSSSNPSQVTPDGQYWHMHMLRELFTGQWGIPLTNTTTGSFWDSTFVFTIPASYYTIPVDIANCEMVAFVTESHQEVYSGHGDYFPLPSNDAGITGASNIPAYTCTGIFTPTVNMKNYGSSTLTSADIIYYVEGETPATYNWTGSLASGADVDVVLPQITTSVSGSGNFIAKVTNPNASTDLNNINDSTIAVFAVFGASTAAPKSENFASSTFPPSGMVLVDADPDGKNWTRSSANGGSAFINWYSITSGKKDDIIISPLDFTGMSNMALSFIVAYRQYSSSYNDKLQVDISTDCGSSWSTLWSKSGATLATGAITTSSFSSPSASEWRFESVALGAYDNTNNVIIRFRATSAYGNNLFLDDINIAANTSIGDEEGLQLISLFPNPADNSSVLKINSQIASDAMVMIYNTLGERVYSSSTYVNSGSTELELNTSDFSNGLYVVKVQIGTEVYKLNLSIAR